MSLTNCQKCQYLDRHPHHQSDILCSLNPAYSSIWQKLNSLDEYTLSCVPIDECREFELALTLENKEITLTLGYEQWQQVTRSSIPASIIQQLKSQTIEVTASLPVREWQDLANRSTSTELVQQLLSQDIEVNFDGLWIDVDSSCIGAIAFDSSINVLQIRFHNSSVYRYDDFTLEDFNDFRHAPSLGQHFNHQIKDFFSYTQLE